MQATPHFFVRAKLSTAVDEYFIKLHCPSSSEIVDLAALATEKWGCRVRFLQLSPAGAPAPQQPAITAVQQTPQWLPEDATLESLDLASGAWLLAVRSSLSVEISADKLVAVMHKLQAQIEELETARQAAMARLVTAVKEELARQDAVHTAEMAELRSLLAAAAPAVGAGEYLFPTAPASAVARLLQARRQRERPRQLPPLTHLMPQAASLVPFAWEAGVGEAAAAASPSLLELLGRWLSCGPAPLPPNVLLEMSRRADHGALVIREAGVGVFQGMPDLAILCQGQKADASFPLGGSAAVVVWKTPGALAAARPHATLQALSVSAPVFFTDMATHVLCCIEEGESVHFYQGAGGTELLSLAEGMGLLQHFLQLDREREVAREASLGSIHSRAMSSGGSSSSAPLSLAAAGGRTVAEQQAQHVLEFQQRALALTHELSERFGVSRKVFFEPEEEEEEGEEGGGEGGEEGEEEEGV